MILYRATHRQIKTMQNETPTQIITNQFYASPDSPLAKSRKQMRWVFLAPLAVILIHPSLVVFLSVGAIFLPLWLLIDYFYKRQLRMDMPVLGISERDIYSPLFRGEKKTYAWAEIKTVAQPEINNIPMLQLEIPNEAGRLPWQKSFKQIMLPLGMFSETDRSHIIQLCLQHQAKTLGVSSDSLPLSKELELHQTFTQEFESLMKYPWLTYGLIAVNVLIWLGMAFKGGNFMLSDIEQLYHLGGLTTAAVQQGEWWRMLTATFLHGGLMHLAMNMVGLYSAGIMVERIYGHGQYAIIYLGAALTGSAMSMHFAAQEVISVGASGAIFGVAGAFLVAVLQHRNKLPVTFSKQTIHGISYFLLYSLVQGFSKDGIDNGAHIGGLIGGMIAAYVLPAKFDLDHYHQKVKSLAAVTIGLILALTTLTAHTAKSAVTDPGKLISSQHLLKEAYVSYFDQVKQMDSDVKAVRSNKMTEKELDQRARSVYAPTFKKVAEDLEQVHFKAGDKRIALVDNMRDSSKIMAEMFYMESIIDPRTGKIEPVDPVRFDQLQRELKEINQRMLEISKQDKH